MDSYNKKYYETHKAERVIWYNANKDKLKKQHQEYRAQNQETELFRRAYRRAKANDLEWDITIEDIVIPIFCPLLEIPLTQIYGQGKQDSNPSLDRIDNSKGYTKRNIRVISNLANIMKNRATPKELLLFSKNIPNYLDNA